MTPEMRIAILTLDEPAIIKGSGDLHKRLSLTGFWGGVHKTRFIMVDATKEQKAESREWLRAHNMVGFFDEPLDQKWD